MLELRLQAELMNEDLHQVRSIAFVDALVDYREYNRDALDYTS